MSVNLPPFQVLLEEHRADVYRFLVATAGPSDADDCFQETWIAALRAYPKLRSGDNLRAWLFRIAQNKSIDAHRARGRRAVPVAAVPERASGGGIAIGGDPELWARASRAAGEAAHGGVLPVACSACPTRSLRCCSSAARTPRGATCTRG